MSNFIKYLGIFIAGSAAGAGTVCLINRHEKKVVYFPSNDIPKESVKSNEKESNVHIYNTTTEEIPQNVTVIEDDILVKSDPEPIVGSVLTAFPVKEKPIDTRIKKIFIDITEYDFNHPKDEAYSQEVLTLYSDGKMYDDSHQRVYAKDTIGMERFKRIVPGKCEVIHVRNLKLFTDYEVIYDDRSSEEVEGAYESADNYEEE